MNKDSKIYVAGHTGLVGSAVCRKLKEEGYNNIITASHKELELIDNNEVKSFFKYIKPEYVFLCAAKVGGIKANSDYPAEFIYQNIKIQTNIIDNSYKYNIKKLLFLGSSCIYPKESIQPIKEEYLLSGHLETTNYGYAVAKISGIKMCQAFNQQYGTNYISVMPTNLYGKNDNYDLNNSHVFPALIRKVYEAKKNNEKEIIVWGTGKPKREFLFSDDCADALLFLINNYNDSDIINVGTGEDISILELTEIICELMEYNGELKLDTSKADGPMRKLLDVTKINELGWKAKTSLREGLKKTIKYYEEERKNKLIPFLNKRWKKVMSKWTNKNVWVFVDSWLCQLNKFNMDDNINLFDSIIKYFQNANLHDIIRAYNCYYNFVALKKQYLSDYKESI